MLGSSWGLLGPPEASWGHLGAFLGPSWGLLGPSEPLGDILKPSWGYLGAILGPSDGHQRAPGGSKVALLGHFWASRRGETLIFAWRQDGPKMATRWPQDGPEGPEEDHLERQLGA